MGSDTPDSVGHWRFYNDLYASFDGPMPACCWVWTSGCNRTGGRTGRLDHGHRCGATTLRRTLVGRAACGMPAGRCGCDHRRALVLGASLGVDCTVNDRTTWRIEGRLWRTGRPSWTPIWPFPGEHGLHHRALREALRVSPRSGPARRCPRCRASSGSAPGRTSPAAVCRW